MREGRENKGNKPCSLTQKKENQTKRQAMKRTVLQKQNQTYNINVND